MEIPAILAPVKRFIGTGSQIVRWRPLAAAFVFTLTGAGVAATLGGRVVEDHSGAPLASVSVRLFRAGAPGLAADLETDRQGRFVADGLPAGDYRMELSKPDYVPASVRLRIDSNTSFSLRLVRCGVIAGRVTGPEGKPVRGAAVFVFVKSRSGALQLFANGSSHYWGQPDGQGQYRVHDLPPGQYAIGVSYAAATSGIGSGFLLYPENRNPEFFGISGGEEHDDVNFSVRANAVFSVSGTADAPADSSLMLTLTAADQPAYPIARSGLISGGDFHFEGISPGTYDLFAAAPDYANRPSSGKGPLYGRLRFEVTGQDVDGLSIPLREGRSALLSVRAAKSAGADCSGAVTVELTPLDDWGTGPSRVATSVGAERQADGLAPGRYSVSIPQPGNPCYLTGDLTPDLSETAEIPRIDLELAPAASIRGQVTGLNGARPSDFVVVILPSGPADAVQPLQLAIPDAQSRFSFADLRPGKYRIAARLATAGGPVPWTADLERMFEIDLPAGTSFYVDLPAPPTPKTP